MIENLSTQETQLELLGKGNGKEIKKIREQKARVADLARKPDEVLETYKLVTGRELTIKDIEVSHEVLKRSQEYREAIGSQDPNVIASAITPEGKQVIVENFEKQYKALEDSFNKTLSENGWAGWFWDGFKHTYGLKNGSDITQQQLQDLSRKIMKLKKEPENFAQNYKDVTGRKLTTDELAKHDILGENSNSFSRTKAAQGVSNYQISQVRGVNGIATVGTTVTVLVLVGTGVAAAPFTGGTSLAAAAKGIAFCAGTGALVNAGIKGTDAYTGGREYTGEDCIRDIASGGANGGLTCLTAGLWKGPIPRTLTTGIGEPIANGLTRCGVSVVPAQVTGRMVGAFGSGVAIGGGSGAAFAGTDYLINSEDPTLEGFGEALGSGALIGGIFGGAINAAGEPLRIIAGLPSPKNTTAHCIKGKNGLEATAYCDKTTGRCVAIYFDAKDLSKVHPNLSAVEGVRTIRIAPDGLTAFNWLDKSCSSMSWTDFSTVLREIQPAAPLLLTEGSKNALITANTTAALSSSGGNTLAASAKSSVPAINSALAFNPRAVILKGLDNPDKYAIAWADNIAKNSKAFENYRLLSRHGKEQPLVRDFDVDAIALFEADKNIIEAADKILSFVDDPVKRPFGVAYPLKELAEKITEIQSDSRINIAPEHLQVLAALELQGKIPSGFLSNIPKDSRLSAGLAGDLDACIKAQNGSASVIDAYIPVLKDLNKETLKKLMPGDFCEYNSRVYALNSAGRPQPLNPDLTRQDIMNLFTPVSRFMTGQGNIGDCGLIVPLDSLFKNPDGRVILLECFSRRGNDIVVKFPNSETSFTLPKGNLPENVTGEHFVNGAPGFKALEAAYGRHLVNQNVQKALRDPNLSQQAKQNLTDSTKDISTADLVYVENVPMRYNRLQKWLLGKEDYTIGSLTDTEIAAQAQRVYNKNIWPDFNWISKPYNNSEQFLRGNGIDPRAVYEVLGLKGEYGKPTEAGKFLGHSNKGNVFTAATKPIQGNAAESCIMPEKTIISEHAYGVTPEDGIYYVTNPHNTAFEIRLTPEEFSKHFGTLYKTKVK